MVQALAGIALLEFTQIEPGAKMIALTVQHGSPRLCGETFKQVAQGKNQGIAECIAFGGTGKADDGNNAVHLKLQVFLGHGRSVR
jgi:hypothetical protein